MGLLRQLLRKFEKSSSPSPHCAHSQLDPRQLQMQQGDVVFKISGYACSSCGEFFSDFDAMLMQRTESKRSRAQRARTAGFSEELRP